QPRPEAAAQRRLEGVGCRRWLGAWERGSRCSPTCSMALSFPRPEASHVGQGIGRSACGPLALLHRPFPFYPFNSFFSAWRKRQSVPSTIICGGLLLILPPPPTHTAKTRIFPSASSPRHCPYGISFSACRT